MEKNKHILKKTYGIYRLSDSGKTISERWTNLEVIEVIEMNSNYDTEEEALDALMKLDNYTRYTILPIYKKVIEY